MKNRFLRGWQYASGQSLFIPVLALQLLTVLVAVPRGNFPLNDDWIFAQMVQTLLAEHHYVHHPFSGPVAVAQVLYGALFCSVFGFSYVTLRCSTLVLAAVGAWATAKCVTECGGSRGAALLGAFVVSANPVFMSLSYTFMTDVPYYAVMTLSALCYLRALRSGRVPDILLGGLFGVIALLVRQLALGAGLAYVLALVFMRLRCGVRISPRNTAAFLVPWCVGAVGLVVWRFTLGGGAASQTYFSTAPITVRMFQVGVCAVAIMTATGLWLLPWTAARIPMSRPWLSEVSVARRLVVGLFFGLSVFVILILWKGSMPAPGNILHQLGTGACSMTGTYLEGFSWKPLIVVAWSVATCLAFLSGGVLLADMAGLRTKTASTPDAEGTLPRRGQRTFLQAWFLLGMGASLSPLVPDVFDRYALTLLPALIAVGAGAFPRGERLRLHPLSVIACGMLYLFSVAGVHDYLAWNSARWQALDYLQNTLGAPARDIDGGFEFNGLHTSGEYMKERGVTNLWECRRGFQWWVIDDKYTVSFTWQSGYKELKSFPFFSWLGGGTYQVLALERG